MSERSTRAGPVWDRLQRNRDRNAPIFADAGIRPERAGAVVCPACGAEESALFWSTTRRRGKMVYLLCPICEEACVRYSLAGNRVLDPVFNRGSVVGGMGVIFLLVGAGALFYFRDTEPVRALVDDALTARAAAVAGLQHATDGRFGGYTAPPPPTGRPQSEWRRGAGSVRAGAPAAASSASLAREPARAAQQRYALPGDRRGELQALASTNGALHEVRYDSAADITYVRVDSTMRGGLRALEALPGARRVDDP